MNYLNMFVYTLLQILPLLILSCLIRAMPTRAEHLSTISPSSDLEGALPLYQLPTKMVGMTEDTVEGNRSRYV